MLMLKKLLLKIKIIKISAKVFQKELGNIMMATLLMGLRTYTILQPFLDSWPVAFFGTIGCKAEVKNS